MGESYVWIGGSRGAWQAARNWWDETRSAIATTAPTSSDTAKFARNATVTGGGTAKDIIVRNGAQVIFAGDGSQEYTAARHLSIEPGARLTLRNALINVFDTTTVSPQGGLDVSHAATKAFNGASYSPLSGDIGALHLRSGGQLILGHNSLLNVFPAFQNDNSGVGNAFDPRAGISGTGSLSVGLGYTPIVHLTAPGSSTPLAGIDFGVLHAGDTSTRSFVLANYAGGPAPPLVGALQTRVNGGHVTSKELSGPGVTPQNFSIPGHGASKTFDVTLTARQAGSIDGQAVHLAYNFVGQSFDVGQTLPITAEVLNYAAPAFVETNGPGTLTHSGNAWTLNLGTLQEGSFSPSIGLAVKNAAAGPADLLSGTFTIGSDPSFLVLGADTFSKVSAGSSYSGLKVIADTSVPGRHSETLVLHPTGSNSSGWSAALSDRTLTITDMVAAR